MADVPDRLQSTLADRYRLEREIGRGGMATVYLATDLRHDREVALKVLRPDLAATLGPERFLREIHIAAKLQHSNILPVHDSGEAGGFLYYVMPFVEGGSLRERLAREGALPVGDAIRILRDVVDALTEAHAHGVVHRDIKPENILLRGRHALVADFGVAKAVSEAKGQQTLTTAGVALGTPAYMAPEQAAADPHLDHRVDIYAAGAVAYEMLTGDPPFMRSTPQALLAAQVSEAPVPVTERRETVPPLLASLVMRCLAKKPADRPQSAAELLQHLDPLTTPSGGTTPTQIRPVIALGELPRWGKWAAGVVGAAVVGLLAFQLLKPRLLNITVSDIMPVTSDAGIEYQPALSPDGNDVVYVAGPLFAPHLFVRGTGNFGGGGTVRLGDTALGSEWFPSWSPDGQSVRFWGCATGGRRPDLASNCTWRESARLGGASREASLPPRVMRMRDLGYSLAWSPDGARVAFASADTIFTFSAADSGLHRVAVLHEGAAPFSLAWSPDGRLLAYCDGDPGQRITAQWIGTSVWIVPAAGGEPQQVAGGDHLNASPAWLDARHLLFVSDRDGGRAVYVVEVGPHGARGEPRPIPGIADPHSIAYSIGSRKLAFARFSVRQNIWSYPLGRAGPISIRDGRPVTTSNQVVETHDLSPDGKWVVYDANLRGRMDLYKAPSGGGQAIPLTTGPIGGQFPRWSPDGREVVFCTPWGTNQVMVMSAQGGAAIALTAPGNYGYPSWSPNGLHIAFQSGRPAKAWKAWLVSRDSVSGPWHEAVQLTDSACYVPDWAPDGRTLACVSGPTRLRLVTVPGGRTENSDLLTANHLRANSVPRFSRDGRTIFSSAVHQDGRQGIWAVPLAGGKARLLAAFDDPAGPPAWIWVSVGPDRLYLTVSEYESDIWVANLRY